MPDTIMPDTTNSTALVQFTPLIQRTINLLDKAKTSADILDVINAADAALTYAQKEERRVRITGAAQTMITACHEAQAQALKIESQAKIRLANEYDGAVERREVRRPGERGKAKAAPKKALPNEEGFLKPTSADIGLKYNDVQEARQLRDAEAKDPGVIAKALDTEIAEGKAPTRTAIKRAVKQTLNPNEKKKPSRTPNPTKLIPFVRKAIRATVEAKGSVPRKKEWGERLGKELGLPKPVSPDTIERAEGEEIARLEGIAEARGDAVVAQIVLPMTAQQKVDAVLKRERAKDAAEIARLKAGINEEVDRQIIKQNAPYVAELKQRDRELFKDQQWYKELINDHKPPFTVAEWGLLQLCVSGDASASTEKRNQASAILNTRRPLLTGEKDKPSVS